MFRKDSDGGYKDRTTHHNFFSTRKNHLFELKQSGKEWFYEIFGFVKWTKLWKVSPVKDRIKGPPWPRKASYRQAETDGSIKVFELNSIFASTLTFQKQTKLCSHLTKQTSSRSSLSNVISSDTQNAITFEKATLLQGWTLNVILQVLKKKEQRLGMEK